VGCRRRADPGDLVRVVAAAEGSAAVGRSLAGRGAWLCAGSPECLDRALRRGALGRALRAPIDPDRVRAVFRSDGSN
jgi:uncharacterized protein